MLNTLQNYGYSVMMSGYNTFLTGGAGTGKTYVINKFVNDRCAQGYNIIVVAPTALAAMNINGVTIHEQFKITYSNNTLSKFKEDTSITYDLADIDIVICDEISMCRMDVFDYMSNYINRANVLRKRKGLPNIQLIVVGDFLQLPPVIKDNENEALNAKYNKEDSLAMAFESVFWKHYNFKVVMLLEIVRQDNKDFIENLNKMRVGNRSSLNYILENSSKIELTDAIYLFGRNSDANLKNTEFLTRLDTPLITAEAEYMGDASWRDSIAEPLLQIKVGAKVISIANSTKDESWECKNGEMGVIEFIDIPNDTIHVKFNSGHYEIIGRHEWEIFRYDIDRTSTKPIVTKNKIGSIKQYPIRLAYAITIHKAQGQTFDAMNIKPYAWDCGQLYVAFSRVRKVENMYIIGDVQEDNIKVSYSVIKFYNDLVREANKQIDTSINLIEHKNTNYADNDMNKILNMLGI